ncbi:MAG: magnesium protoporphyrin IX methyltransferase [Pseudomonadota bacterium]
MSDATNTTYERTRGRLEEYFDRTASETWARLTSDAPVSKIRQTVREGRDRMRATLLCALPAHLTGRRVLDAGCGVGQAAVELARRGADVVAVDISGSLLDVARERAPEDVRDKIDWRVGDFSDPSLGEFDHVLAMDSLIHYAPGDIVSALAGLAARTRDSIVFTTAPRTPLLSMMHVAGKLFPRSDRSPAIFPVSERDLRRRIARHNTLSGWVMPETHRISSGFYISTAMELRQ